ncbi:hypothetical protein [Bradyrhizobium sp. Tv2a-2]|uniref:hypothetical protein n=1 Tax=Bradyrhizobium sp. Tv2a-2 TaxID=113395 RepID=UPI0003FFBA8C|nr:hypothetical protein [Bradyrhizobium sp. Tv2a-2]
MAVTHFDAAGGVLGKKLSLDIELQMTRCARGAEWSAGRARRVALTAAPPRRIGTLSLSL